MTNPTFDLNHAVPEERFAAIYGDIRKTPLATTVSELRTRRSKDVPPTLMFIWDEMVHRGIARAPFKIAPIVNSGFKGIYEFVQRELGKAPLTAAYAVKYFSVSEADNSFAEVSLVHCFPNDIHICDVEFSDQRHPLPANHPDRKFRRYKGLHVFDEFIDRLCMVARARDADRISGLVASPPVHYVLARHGFRVSDSKMAQAAARTVGHGHAMILSVAA